MSEGLGSLRRKKRWLRRSPASVTSVCSRRLPPGRRWRGGGQTRRRWRGGGRTRRRWRGGSRRDAPGRARRRGAAGRSPLNRCCAGLTLCVVVVRGDRLRRSTPGVKESEG